MARPKRQNDTPETRAQILQAARIEFAEQGIAAPLEAIAARCGIKRPSLLHHFSSKQALIAAVTDDILRMTRERLLSTISSPDGDYATTMQKIFGVLRELEREEQGVAGVLVHAMMAEDKGGPVTSKMAEFIDIIYASSVMAGSQKTQNPEEFRAAIAHLVIGEATRVALGSRAKALWGNGDGLTPLFSSYFLDDNTRKPDK
ncbi:TetR/AcrR family transcriptional regulator [Zhongshania borealis]|jgi:AcrR family transcriptional regulator|uniref:HTH tetR-type domain-containing protein n=1 Tax=Zhongshania borealis TaxID=889488 RepID=A0ABP7WRE6_9GAMM|tara:strand:+ start:886 stop:1491 length:606 start_codon:yes stop_codon:yes gene_type:complete